MELPYRTSQNDQRIKIRCYKIVRSYRNFFELFIFTLIRSKSYCFEIYRKAEFQYGLNKYLNIGRRKMINGLKSVATRSFVPIGTFLNCLLLH